MVRTRKEWYKFCMDRGTYGSQVFDILDDWKESLPTEKEIEKILNKAPKDGYSYDKDLANTISRRIGG